jgi:hypothetical protein
MPTDSFQAREWELSFSSDFVMLNKLVIEFMPWLKEWASPAMVRDEDSPHQALEVMPELFARRTVSHVLLPHQ